MHRNLISTHGLKKSDILHLIERAEHYRTSKYTYSVKNDRAIGLLFFEPSTRTRIGFEAAAWKLGIKSITLSETKLNNKMSGAESIEDTIRTLNAYVSCYCVRHPEENIYENILPYTEHPVINCGNGSLEHPSQALIDVYAIWSKFKKLNDLNITILGNPRHTRSTHSLINLLSVFNGININEVCPDALSLQDEHIKNFNSGGNKYQHSKDHEWGKENVVYVTGFPPKTPSGNFSKKQRDRYKITTDIVSELNTDCIILNPLPRIDEIDVDVDSTKNAYYFKQNQLGLYMRMAIIEKYFL